MNPDYPPGSQQPPPIGFEMQQMPQQPPPLGFEGVAAPDQPPPPDGNLYPKIPDQPEVGDRSPLISDSTSTLPRGNPIDYHTMDNNGGPNIVTVAPLYPSTGDDDMLPDSPGKKQPLIDTVVEQNEDGTAEVKISGLDENGEIDKKSTVYFNDGVSKIDFVLAYKDSSGDKDDSSKIEKRRVFMERLKEEGLELELEDKALSQDGKTHFVKIHAPWEVLTRLAEIMSIKMPIKAYDGSFEPTCWDKIPSPFDLPEELIKEEADYFTADFNREREHIFIIKDKDTFFTGSQRSLMVYTILLRTRYDEEDRQKFGIDRLVKHGTFTAAFPLHDGPHTSSHSILTHGAANERHLLYEAWARPGRWYYNQPLDEIRRYFGERIAIYFSWLGFYTTMLIPASFVGLIVFIYGCSTVFSNPPSNEICDENGAGNFTMCPLCDGRCSYWKLHTSCKYSRLTYLFDNYGTVFFAGFMSIWATCFLEFWKRKQAEIQYDWDVATYDIEERMRPDYEAKCDKKKLNPVTQDMEPFLPVYSKIPRVLTSVVVILFMIFCVLAAVFGVIMYRIIVVAVLYASETEIVRSNAKLTTTATAALINLIAIMILNKVYERVAMWLTELERPRTDSDFEDSFTFKMFLFQFINYYTSIFYIAYFKGRLGGRPGDYDYRLGYRAEECDPAGCLIELCIQLAIVMIGKQAFNNFKEIMLPKILNYCRRRNAKAEEENGNQYTRWEQDNDLQVQPALGLFEEYLEMVIQYGFVTIFVAAFPLAPLFALVNNVIEIRLDAYKFVTQWKRPVAERANDIGIWFGILRGVSFIAVLTNAFIIGWTSDFIPKMVFKFAESDAHALSNYVNHSLSYFDVSDFQARSIPDNPRDDLFGNVTICRYHDYRHPPDVESPLEKYTYTAEHWHIFMGRLAFVIIFEHVVFFLTWLVTYLIPDVPGHVRQLMLREMFLAKEARYESAFVGVHDEKRDRMSKSMEDKSQ